ncbi:shikimate kinase [Pandoraea capi]|uniref:shikimate kinase n=1 Tax=Pandoraea capi TaxID=2508286 RepID=A0ABY6W6B9_9BURK|nr:shikimate kinase [Pandoraea capi]
MRIPVIFEHEGEEGFRQRETQTIDELTQRSGIVLATGGGAVLRAENREYIKSRGTVVYLRANPHDLWLRTRRDKNRPLLQTADPRARLEQLYQERDALYRECATFIIETGRPSVNALVNMVLMQLEVAGIVPSAADLAVSEASDASEMPEGAQGDTTSLHPAVGSSDAVGEVDVNDANRAGDDMPDASGTTDTPGASGAISSAAHAGQQSVGDIGLPQTSAGGAVPSEPLASGRDTFPR